MLEELKMSEKLDPKENSPIKPVNILEGLDNAIKVFHLTIRLDRESHLNIHFAVSIFSLFNETGLIGVEPSSRR